MLKYGFLASNSILISFSHTEEVLKNTKALDKHFLKFQSLRKKLMIEIS